MVTTPVSLQLDSLFLNELHREAPRLAERRPQERPLLAREPEPGGWVGVSLSIRPGENKEAKWVGTRQHARTVSHEAACTDCITGEMRSERPGRGGAGRGSLLAGRGRLRPPAQHL